MNPVRKKFIAGATASLLLALFVAGCSSKPEATSAAPGQDLTPEARADKRGDVPVPGAPMAAPSGTQTAPATK